jgi:hypothetical protein
MGLDTENFFYRWFNDVDQRLVSAQRAGYEFVLQSEVPSVGDYTVESSKGTDSRVVRGVGFGTKAYLMKLPLEFKKEYDAAKEAEISETERAMHRSKNQSQHGAAQGADIVNANIASVRGRERIVSV